MECAHPRGGTSVRSWLESVPNRVTTRGNVSCPIARQALRRSRILLWVGQRSKATIDPKWEEYYLQDGQLRTSCRSRVIGQFWEQFVLYNSITGLVDRRCTLSLWKQGCINLIFSHQETGAGILKNPKPKWKEEWQEEFGRSVGRYSSLVDRVHRQSCGRIACTRTQFSENRLGTSCRSGDKIKESKYLFSLSERPQLRRLLANQNNKGSLQKTHWRSSTSCRKVRWLDNGGSQRP